MINVKRYSKIGGDYLRVDVFYLLLFVLAAIIPLVSSFIVFKKKS